MAQHFDPASALAAILTEHGPLSEEDIEARLAEAGAADPEAVVYDLLEEYNCPAGELPDGRWVWLPTLLAGRVFTHRLTAEEITHDLLAITPDLDPITELCQHDGHRQLADGAPLQVVLPGFDGALLESRGVPVDLVADEAAVLLEPGTLAGLGVAAGELLGLRLTAGGLALEPVTATSRSGVGERLAGLLDTDEPTRFEEAVWAACAEDPALFSAPSAPLGELADEHGLARDGEWLAPAGFDFDRWHFEKDSTRLARRHDLDPDDAVALNTLLKIYEQLGRLFDVDEAELTTLGDVDESEPTGDGRYGELLADMGAVLADPLLAHVLAEETGGDGRRGAAALGMLVEMLQAKVPRSARVAARWLQAVARERLGDTAGFERELLAAESLDPDWPLPLFDLARFASDRGDAEAGLALLRRAGADSDDPLVHLLERHRTQPRNDIGRNEPCWCGSGRKYKKCHLGNERLSLEDRVGWLYAKASQHALGGEWRDLLAELGLERHRHTDEFPDNLLAAAAADPLVIDAILFEGGAFEEFLAVRGALLPDDERLLAEQWLLTERSVFDVEQVRPGHGVTVRDVRTGDVHEVSERTASRQLQPGQLICARVLPTGDTRQFFGGIEPVALHERDRLIELLDDEPDPVELVSFLSRRFAPPTIVNTEGDPIADCRAELRVGDPVAVAAELDECYERTDDEDAPQWIEFVTTDGAQRVRATLALDGDTLSVQTNSERRLDRVLAVLRGIDPAMEVLDETRTPMGDLRQAAKLAGQSPPAEPVPETPEMRALVEQMIREYEQRWLDEPIPALNGLTPRRAADDPTRRGDLIRLLDTFPSGAAAGHGMNADRLRAALGLE